MSFTDPTVIDPGLLTEPSALRQRVEAYLTAYMPDGWMLPQGSLADLMIEAFCEEAAIQAAVANQKLISDFRYFGKLVNVPPVDATPATAACTFTVKDTAGYTIDAGSVVGIQDPTGTLQGFDLVADLVIPNGSSTGTGTVTAETPGAVADGLSGTAQLVNVPAFVTAATLATSSGGVDAELDDVYLPRLVETLQLLSPRPILPVDFAVLARSVAGVFSAVAVDLLKPGPPYDVAAEATGQEKNVTVAVKDINGNSVGSTVRGNVQTFLQGLREQNFKVWVVDPQYSAVDVSADVYGWPGVDLTDLQARVTTALQTRLSPATANADATGNPARWVNDPTLRLAELHQVVMSVEGVRYVDPLTFALHGNALGTADITLGAGSQIPALPTVGTITLTMHATT